MQYMSGPAVLHILYEPCSYMEADADRELNVFHLTLHSVVGHKAALASVLSSQRANVHCAKGLKK